MMMKNYTQSHNTITSTGLNLINCKTPIILHHPHCCYVYIPVYNLFAHSLAHRVFLLIFIIHSILYCTFYLIAHPTLFILLLFHSHLYYNIIYIILYSHVLCFIVFIALCNFYFYLLLLSFLFFCTFH